MDRYTGKIAYSTGLSDIPASQRENMTQPGSFQAAPGSYTEKWANESLFQSFAGAYSDRKCDKSRCPDSSLYPDCMMGSGANRKPFGKQRDTDFTRFQKNTGFSSSAGYRKPMECLPGGFRDSMGFQDGGMSSFGGYGNPTCFMNPCRPLGCQQAGQANAEGNSPGMCAEKKDGGCFSNCTGRRFVNCTNCSFENCFGCSFENCSQCIFTSASGCKFERCQDLHFRSCSGSTFNNCNGGEINTCTGCKFKCSARYILRCALACKYQNCCGMTTENDTLSDATIW